MMRLLQSSWLAVLLGTVADWGTTLGVLRVPAGVVVPQVHAVAKPSPDNDPSWRFRNPEFDQWLAEVKAEKAALAVREQELRELQARIEAERAELAGATQAVVKLQAEFDRSVVRFQEQGEENLRRQVKLLGAMPLETAVKMLAGMGDEEVARLLSLMKTEQVGLFLDALSKAGKEESKRAGTLLDLMRRTMPPPAAAKNPGVGS